MTNVWIGNRSFSAEPSALVGEGGEAEIYQIAPDTVLKLFKTPSHPQFQGATPQAQSLSEAARLRIQERQLKLLAFPVVPPHVVAPTALAWSSTNQSRSFVGYSMPLIDGAYTLREYSQRSFRESGGITPSDVVEVFLDLHNTLKTLHQNKIVIGDCNPMNVLVNKKQAYLIDADSLQFDAFACSTYCSNYVDPLICRTGVNVPEMVGQHSELTDWYAFAILFWECLLCVHPYGGVFKPGNPSQRCSPSERPLKRISVLHPDVRYPAAAVPFNTLPDPLLDFYCRLLVNDERREFPATFLENLRFRNDQGFLVQKFFVPGQQTPRPASRVTNENNVARSVFSTSGVILQCTIQNRRVRYLYHSDGQFRRDSGDTVLTGPLDPAMNFRIIGDKTIASKAHNTFCLQPGTDPVRIRADRFRNALPIFETNNENYFWIEGGVVWKNSSATPIRLTDVLEGQTRIAVGTRFGFGFYSAGEYRKAFLFRLTDGVKATVDASVIEGTLVDYRCHFGNNAIWFLTTRQEQTKIVNCCTLIDYTGALVARAECDEGADHWLSHLDGKCASFTGNDVLYATAEHGLVCIEPSHGQLVETRQLSLTTGMIQPNDNLLFSQDGIYTWNRHEIRLLTPNSRSVSGNQPKPATA